jgi:hypothetical protein
MFSFPQTPVGILLTQLCARAPTLKRISMELGGNVTRIRIDHPQLLCSQPHLGPVWDLLRLCGSTIRADVGFRRRRGHFEGDNSRQVSPLDQIPETICKSRVPPSLLRVFINKSWNKYGKSVYPSVDQSNSSRRDRQHNGQF